MCVYVFLLQPCWRADPMSSSAVTVPAYTAPSSATRFTTVRTTAMSRAASTVSEPKCFFFVFFVFMHVSVCIGHGHMRRNKIKKMHFEAKSELSSIFLTFQVHNLNEDFHVQKGAGSVAVNNMYYYNIHMILWRRCFVCKYCQLATRPHCWDF